MAVSLELAAIADGSVDRFVELGVDADEVGRVMVRGKNGTVLLPVDTSSVSSPVTTLCATGFDMPLCIITGLPSKSEPLPTFESAFSLVNNGTDALGCCSDCLCEGAFPVARFPPSSVSFFAMSSMFRFITISSGIAMLISMPAAEIFARRMLCARRCSLSLERRTSSSAARDSAIARARSFAFVLDNDTSVAYFLELLFESWLLFGVEQI